MNCQTCDMTMCVTEHEGFEFWWCERCGTITAGFSGDLHTTVPRLPQLVIEFAGKLTDEHEDLIAEFERLGIRDAVVSDEVGL